MIDVKGRRCEVVHCTKIAGYGVQGRQPSACLLHRESGMVDMKQHRPRLGSGKAGSINVNLGSGGAAAAESSASSFAKWGRRSRKNIYGVPGAGANGIIIGPSSQSAAAAVAGGMDSTSSLELMRLARHANGGGNNPSASQQWYSDPGYSSGMSSQSGGQALRSWVMGGTPPQLAGGGGAGGGVTGPGVPTVGMWAFNNPSGSVSSRGDGGVPHPSAHWTPSQDGGNGQGNDGSHYAHESGSTTGLAGRGGASTLSSGEAPGGRFAVGGGYGNDGGGDRDGWRTGAPGAPGFSESSYQQFSGSAQGVDQNGYPVVSGGGRGGGGGGGSGGHGGGGGGGEAATGGSSSVKAEHGPNSEVGIVDVETEDIWLRDLMQGTMTRESHQNSGSGGGGGGATDVSHSSSAQSGGMPSAGSQRSAASHTVSGSQYSHRHLSAPSSAGAGDHAPPSARSGTPFSSNPVLVDDRRSFHQGQNHRQQQRPQSNHSSGSGGGNSPQDSRPSSHGYDPVLSVSSGGRYKEAMNANARAKGMAVHMTMGRSPSTASNGASPPHDSGNSSTDAMPQRHAGGGSKHDGVGGGASAAVSGGGGGNPGINSSGFLSRSSARGAGPPNHLFTNLSGMAGHDGGGYGVGLNPDMQLMSASRVPAPSWGGV
eukprot:jgi/Undpi1/8139/HiC_scaffold_24.g10610.m1